MPFRVVFALLLSSCVLVAAAASEDFRLVGLVDLPGFRAVCVQLGSGPAATLHPGDSAFGFVLKDFDATASWARFSQGTNEFRIWVNQSSGAPQDSQTASTAFNTRRGRQNSIGPGSQNTTVALAQVGADGRATDQANATGHAEPTTSEGLWAFENAGAKRTLNETYSGVGAPTQIIQDPNPNSSTVAPEKSNPLAPDTVTSTSSALSEGDSVRLFYGTQAFLAWDRQRIQR